MLYEPRYTSVEHSPVGTPVLRRSKGAARVSAAQTFTSSGWPLRNRALACLQRGRLVLFPLQCTWHHPVTQGGVHVRWDIVMRFVPPHPFQHPMAACLAFGCSLLPTPHSFSVKRPCCRGADGGTGAA